jgi:hypothetical protein
MYVTDKQIKDIENALTNIELNRRVRLNDVDAVELKKAINILKSTAGWMMVHGSI